VLAVRAPMSSSSASSTASSSISRSPGMSTAEELGPAHTRIAGAQERQSAQHTQQVLDTRHPC
jgi:hypothetical protein